MVSNSYIKPIFFVVTCVMLVLQGCSRKKDTFINRNFHALGTKYNVLYNGNLALERGKETINDAFTENFWELLPVERMAVNNDVFLPEQSKNQDFQRAEEKAIKAVQVHGMNINGKEKNPQIDEAYLLLGKARYYDQRFVPALAAFNYILNKYPTSDKINQAKIWREKVDMRIDNNVIAIKNLKKLMAEAELNDQDFADASATIAQAYINTNAKDSAMVHLQRAANFTKHHHEKARYLYIRGQLFNQFQQKDSANAMFDEIINMHRKIPRAFYVNAKLEKVKNFDFKEQDSIAFKEELKDIAENRENRPYLDKIYHEIAEFYKRAGNMTSAEIFYNKSLRENQADKLLTSKNYETLGNMFFDRNIYKTAGFYYDSTMAVMQPRTKPYRLVKRKRENLEDVIYYEGIAVTNDSILKIVRLPKEEQLAIFQELADLRKQQAKEAQDAREKAARIAANNKATQIANTTSFNRQTNRRTKNEENSSFYFYNPTTVAYGKNEFLKLWGDRKLQDNWRLSKDKAGLEIASTDIAVADLEDSEQFKAEFYLKQLPQNQQEIDSIRKERNFAYYQLGILYKEKFKEFNLAKTKLERLLKNNPEDRLILPSKYNLYRIYEQLELNQKAAITKADIIKNYPESRYAEILLNPNELLEKSKNSPAAIYETLYEKFNNQNYEEVIAETETFIKKFEGEPIVPKLEMLKASAKGRLHGLEAYKEGVNYVALTYPNSEEGKQAQLILQQAMPVLEKKTFLQDKEAQHFNIIYKFENSNQNNLTAFAERLNKLIAQVEYFDLSTSIDVYDPNNQFVVIHGLKSRDGATGFAETLKSDKKTNGKRKIKEEIIKKPYFTISSENYKIVQRHKNLSNYLESQ